ncbi:hypothetical protein J2T09_002363 [Neorhizobium huautlense]|uniref:Uncharacterized protein n=1 Tax=Neorhizobium huautlense TaxID=67774 RepID=A0ABT9PT18_9HYPH|nr:hypothetical protein [Neorhizobium huautlense]MDP9837611.1 hypothetical protein [Neorhizobium huautlense]
MERTLIGDLFGAKGFFVSQPGDDVSNPQKALILDSRFSSLEIHASGVFNLSITQDVNNTYFISGQRSWAALGYNPLYYITFLDQGSSVVSYPPQITYINGSGIGNLSLSVGSAGLSINFYIEGGQAGNRRPRMGYVIFKRPR